MSAAAVHVRTIRLGLWFVNTCQAWRADGPLVARARAEPSRGEGA